MTTRSSQAQALTVLYAFTGGTDGVAPYGSLVRDKDGNLYGTTLAGGAYGQGTVFKLDITGNETVLYSFTGGVDGGSPYHGVIRDTKGNLYGTTYAGGDPVCSCGTVFRIDPSGKETVLHAFVGGTDGATPDAGLVRDPVGNLYGTTSQGGSFNLGTVFKVDRRGNETLLHTFSGGFDDGEYPDAALVRDNKTGILYGTTSQGGGGYGTVFELDTNGIETILYVFPSQATGQNPKGILRDSKGNIYGTTDLGGSLGEGTVFKLDATDKETVLYSFNGGTDGTLPLGVFVRAGKLYGTTYYGGDPNCDCGTVFSLTAAGKRTVLYSFTGGTDGRTPAAGLVRDSAGNLYGAALGGAYGYGVVFKLTP